MTTPLTTAEIVERLRKGIQQRQKHILDGDGNAIGLAGYTFDVDGTDTLMSEAATVIETLERVMEYMRHWEARAEAAEAELAKVREAFSPGGLISAAAENLRSADHDDRRSEAAFRIAYQLDALRAALSGKTV